MVYYILHIYLVTFGHVLLRTNAELFSAMCEVETLLDTQKRIRDYLGYYIKGEEQRLLVFKRHLHVYKTEHEKAMEDIPNYLGNPINTFTLIKRLTTDLDHIKNIQLSTEHMKNMNVLHTVLTPTMEDLTGAAQALGRLQEVYNLSVSDLSEGILNGVTRSTPMSAGDCFELGRALYNEKDFEHALAWMMQALRKHRDTTDLRPLNEADILEYISSLIYFIGKTTTQNIRREKSFATSKQKSQETFRYQSLCRGEMKIPAEVSKRLQCRYVFGPHPFLRVAPLKMELLYWRPRVALFHHVLSDTEIQHIKDLAKPRLNRARVTDPKTGELVPAQIRISKSTWLQDEESPVVARVTQRVTDMTGLNMLIAEELLVVNYGIGGHYKPHFDFTRNNEFAFKMHHGNRIASVLFYMSDVTQGGATVFTELGLGVLPIKGAALFWMNLHPSGEGDFATRHAACPVLQGCKWVSNKWIHQVGQELLRPCSLHYQPEGFLGKLPHPVPTTVR